MGHLFCLPINGLEGAVSKAMCWASEPWIILDSLHNKMASHVCYIAWQHLKVKANTWHHLTLHGVSPQFSSSMSAVSMKSLLLEAQTWPQGVTQALRDVSCKPRPFVQTTFSSRTCEEKGWIEHPMVPLNVMFVGLQSPLTIRIFPINVKWNSGWSSQEVEMAKNPFGKNKTGRKFC